MSILSKIQSELKAPKGQYNKFGKYAYRNLEDIQEALKPILAKHHYSIVINDAIELIGDRYYIKATISLYDDNMALVTHSSAYAREALSQKGMSESQITGTASSYARKYAMNALFAIDDTKDDDSIEAPKVVMINDAQMKLVNTLITVKGVDRTMVQTAYNVTSLKDLTAAQTQKVIKQLESKEDIPV